jgi:hypothetical protein
MFTFLFLGSVVGLSSTQADTITGADTVGLNTYTTMDGLVTLNPFAAGLTPGTFNANPAFIGVAGGSNANGVDDGDGDASTTADRESLEMLFDPTVGLSQITFRFTRADGPLPTDGVQISGFNFNPGAVFSGGTGSVSYDSGSVFINHPWNGGTTTTVDFSSVSASFGQTLTLTANDSDEAGPQTVINSISYAAVPEPSTLALLGLGLGAFVLRRQR